jgi:nicotinate-nucleotide adenylyltransferase
MEFFRRAPNRPARLGVFPGAFNPVTIAHLALANGALTVVDEVVFVLPQVFPHKPYDGATFEQRLELLQTALAAELRFSIASSERGLFIEIGRECREHYGYEARLSFLCGRDAAERIASWDYGRPGAWFDMLREFDLLVADRGGTYQPSPGELASFRQISIDPACDAVSASEVRRRIANGEPWDHLVPEAIRTRVREIYHVA